MKQKLLFQISAEDTEYIALLKGQFNPAECEVALNNSSPVTVTEVLMRAKEKKCGLIATSNPKLLQLLLGQVGAKLPSVNDYAGSMFEYKGQEILILPPIKQLVTIPHMKFLYARFLSKLLKPQDWRVLPDFTWEVFQPENTERLVNLFLDADFISCDIETIKHVDRIITCVGFTASYIGAAREHLTHSVVVPFNSSYNHAFISAILRLPQMKVFQNGKYDNSYLMRYGIPAVNWSGDTLNLFHSWLSELPKNLGFIAAFTLRKWEYWKHESDTGDLEQYYRYNAKDCFATAMSWISLLAEVPQYALENYKKEFPLVFPCLQTELTGLKRDNAAMEASYAAKMQELEKELASFRVCVASPNYNPSSPPQTLRLFEVLGSGDIKSSDANHRDKVADRHPLNKLLMNKLTNYREGKKLATTYLRDEGEKPFATKSWKSRILYSLNPHATDTGRLASRESSFWCGWQIQNIPGEMKFGIVADDGFYIGECDYAQNEARGTAYISGDTRLIATVDDPSKDFHGSNAAAFFGVPYESIVKSTPVIDQLGNILEWIHKVIDKALRDLSKRTNHGANYNMGPAVMLDTMGIENVRRAKRLLGLPENWSLLRVTAYLLEQYEKAYPVVKGAHYERIINDVANTGYLVGATGWTRRCFGNPKTSKPALNAYVAHDPQSLAAMQLNIAYRNVFNNVARKYPADFKLGPQIHDSILFQYRCEREEIAWLVAKNMKVSIPVKDTFGKVRTLQVPTDLKGGATKWSEVKTLTRQAA